MGIVSLGIFEVGATVSFCEVFWELLAATLEVDRVLVCVVPSEDKVRAWVTLVLLLGTPSALLLIIDLALTMLGLVTVFSGGLLTLKAGADLAGSADLLF